MKKILYILLILTICACSLGGCSSSIQTSSGLTSFCYENAERYTVGGADISDTVESVEIQWFSGKVRVAVLREDTVTFSEEANRMLTNDNSIHFWLDGTTLRIQFCGSGEWDFNGLKKDLTVLLPETLMLKELRINSVSAGMEVDSIRAEELQLNTMSGNLEVMDCAVTEKADLKTTSGAVTLILPEDAGMTLSFYTVSGSFSSELPGKVDGKRFVSGDGFCECSIDTTSGNVGIQVSDGEKADTK